MATTPLPTARINDLFHASNALAVVQGWAILNPSQPLRACPHVAEANRLHRRATGSINVLWVCPRCTSVMPIVDAEARTECCGVVAHLDI